MKYYKHSSGRLLIDINDYTPYLADRGYVEITKEEYDEIQQERAIEEGFEIDEDSEEVEE